MSTAETVTVKRIIDGDTLVVKTPRSRDLRVRLWGIDAPEIDQAGGEASADALGKVIEHVGGWDVEMFLEIMAFDVYGRAIGLLYAPKDGRLRSINCRMLAVGHAYCQRGPKGTFALSAMGFHATEQRARRARRGLWSDPRSEPPWIFRKRARTYTPAPFAPVAGRLMLGALKAIGWYIVRALGRRRL